MKTKTIQFRGNPLELKEMMYFDLLDLNDLKDNKREYTKKIFELSGVDKEILNSISIEEGNSILKEVNELNNFQNPSA